MLTPKLEDSNLELPRVHMLDQKSDVTARESEKARQLYWSLTVAVNPQRIADETGEDHADTLTVQVEGRTIHVRLQRRTQE